MKGMPPYEASREQDMRWGQPLWRRLAMALAMNTVIGCGVAMLIMVFEYHRGGGDFWSRMWVTLLYAQVYAHCTGDLAFLVPPVAMRLSRLRGWRKWPPYLVLLVVLGVVGAALATSVLSAARVAHWGDWWVEFVFGARICVLATVIIGVATYTIERLREQVQATTLQLRTQQLERERALKLAAEARFDSLQSRLQPHFLFNTINSILALLREDAPRAEEMLERLARLLRFALDSQQKPVVRLSEELRLVTDYLEIERTRFGGRLRFTIDAPAELGAVEIPAYSLQTLVENSMKHAVAPRRDGGAVSIRVRREDDALVAEVSDDGPGFSGEALRVGHGLDMLEQRLEALYGAAASIEIATPKKGACVRFRLPMGAMA